MKTNNTNRKKPEWMNETIAIKKIEWKWKWKKSTENRSVAIFHYFMKITRFEVAL